MHKSHMEAHSTPYEKIISPSKIMSPMKRGLLHQANGPTIAPSELNTSEQDSMVPLLAHLSSANHHQEEICMPWDAKLPMLEHTINE